MLKELTEEEFKRRAARSGRVAVFREFLADRETPVAALTRLGGDEEAFLLESVAGGEVRGRYSYLGIDPYARFEGDGALGEVRAALAEARYEPAPELPSFQGGAVGYVAYLLFYIIPREHIGAHDVHRAARLDDFFHTVFLQISAAEMPIFSDYISIAKFPRIFK